MTSPYGDDAVEHVKMNPIADDSSSLPRPRPRASVMTLLTRMDDRTGRMAKTLVLGMFGVFALLGATFGLVIAGAEFSKETHVASGQIVSAADRQPVAAAATPTRTDVTDLLEYAQDSLGDIAERVSLDDKLILTDETGTVRVLRIASAAVRETDDDVVVTYSFANDAHGELALSLRALAEPNATTTGRALKGVGASGALAATFVSSAYPDCKALNGPGWCYDAFKGKCKTPCKPIRTWPGSDLVDQNAANKKKDCDPGYYWNYRMNKCWPRLVVDEKRPPADN